MQGHDTGIDVQYVARLARMDLTDAETARFQGQLAQIVDYVRKIGELDVSGDAPASFAADRVNVFREDAVLPGGVDRGVLMDNAPSAGGDLFRVPRIIE